MGAPLYSGLQCSWALVRCVQMIRGGLKIGNMKGQIPPRGLIEFQNPLTYRDLRQRGTAINLCKYKFDGNPLDTR